MWPFRRRRRATNEETLPIDPAMGDQLAAQLKAAAQRGDWRTISDLLTPVDHPDDHAFYVRTTAYTTGVESWIDEWVAAEPRSTLPLLVKGAHAIDWAWEARGGGRAHTVSQEAFRIFFRRLKLAEDCLDEVTDRDPDSATPWALLVILGRGRQLGIDETRRRFEEARRRHPWHLQAHVQMLQQLCRKWSGSHELMHEFAGRTAVEMPAGSPLGVLVADAHLEQWLDAGDGKRGEYITSSQVRRELLGAANRSVAHPDHELRPGWPTVHNTFAMALALSDEYAAAAERFDQIGSLVTEWPWQYQSRDPGAGFVRWRKRTYAELGR